jgi:serine protease Do
MSMREKRWPFHFFFLLLGLALGAFFTHQVDWFVPGGEKQSGAQKEPLICEATPRASEDVRSIETSLSAVAQHAMPAVVNIASFRIYQTPEGRPSSPLFQDPFFRDFFGDDFSRFFGVPRERVERSLGSGVIVAVDGYISTNNHVVSGANQVTVILADKREFEAKVVGTDPKTDVALLKIDGTDLPAIPLGNSDRARVGDIVLAIGNPFGIGQTVTMGIISATGRSHVGIADYEDFIQTDAAINPGNSGGALVDIEGDLVRDQHGHHLPHRGISGDWVRHPHQHSQGCDGCYRQARQNDQGVVGGLSAGGYPSDSRRVRTKETGRSTHR